MFIGHPGGGQSDVLWIINRKVAGLGNGEILLNRCGHITYFGRFDNKGKSSSTPLTWEDYICSDHETFVQEIEKHAGLPYVPASPTSNGRIVT